MSIFNHLMRPISLLGTVAATFNFGLAVSSYTQTCLSSAHPQLDSTHQGCEEAEHNLMERVRDTMLLLTATIVALAFKKLSPNREQSN